MELLEAVEGPYDVAREIGSKELHRWRMEQKRMMGGRGEREGRLESFCSFAVGQTGFDFPFARLRHPAMHARCVSRFRNLSST